MLVGRMSFHIDVMCRRWFSMCLTAALAPWPASSAIHSNPGVVEVSYISSHSACLYSWEVCHARLTWFRVGTLLEHCDFLLFGTHPLSRIIISKIKLATPNQTLRGYYGWGRAIANMAHLVAAILVSAGWTKMCFSAMLTYIYMSESILIIEINYITHVKHLAKGFQGQILAKISILEGLLSGEKNQVNRK